MNTLPKVGLVGRPNVGKSTLFNRLLGRRQAVVAPIAGTTRDRLEEEVRWNQRSFTLVDMAGIEPSLQEKNELSQAVQAQVARALEEADLFIWVVDSTIDPTHLDQQVARLLRDRNKPVVLVANKCDDPKHDLRQYEYAQFGFPLVALSAVHGRGINELLDAVTEQLPVQSATRVEPQQLRLAIAGRPNVGKSTLLNILLGEKRSVVSAVAGTTRDAVDSLIPAEQLFGKLEHPWKTVRLIDTAGIRRRGKVGQQIESWSVIRTLEAIDRAQVVLLLLDASEGMVHQDLQVAQQLADAGRAVVLVLNKWDVVLAKKGIEPGTPEDQEQQEKLLEKLRYQAPFLHWVQVLFLSATEGWNIEYLAKRIIKAYQAWSFVPTAEQLAEMTEALRRMPLLKNLQRITLEHSQPPTFHLHVEGRNLPHFSAHRAAENALREHLFLGPTPIKIWSVPSIARLPK